MKSRKERRNSLEKSTKLNIQTCNKQVDPESQAVWVVAVLPFQPSQQGKNIEGFLNS